MTGDAIVTPPGGPRLSRLVHQVDPGQAVRRTDEGSYAYVTGGSEMTEDYVLTPGGYRARSQVHQIHPDTVLDATEGRHRMVHRSGVVLADFGWIPPREEGVPLMPGNVFVPVGIAPALGTGWITYAYWNRPSTPISSFSTTWVVPPEPSTKNSQLIYLFNGIQNSTMIFQPVLQWGSNGSFGGNYWCVATWYADGLSGQAFHSTPVTVSTGTTLTGVMTLTSQNPQGFTYDGSFQGIANSGYTIQNVAELWQAVQTLEAYRLTTCTDYPNTGSTAMSSISIQTGATQPDVVWTPVDAITDCGQHTLVFDQGAAGHGEVDLWYRPSPWWTVGTGTVAAGASTTWWFGWGGDGDVGPQLIQAQPVQTSDVLWTTEVGEIRDGNGNLGYRATVSNAGSQATQFLWRGGGR